MSMNGYAKQYACPACGKAATTVISTSSLKSCIIRQRRCLECGYIHETCETGMEMSALAREAIHIVTENRALMLKQNNAPAR